MLIKMWLYGFPLFLEVGDFDKIALKGSQHKRGKMIESSVLINEL